MASTAIPTSTSVVESTVIRAPLSNVWHLIKLQNFADFWSALDKSEFVKSASSDTDVVKWTFKDGSVTEVKQEEHSVSGCAVGQGYYRMENKEGGDTLTFPRLSTTTSPTASSRPSRRSPIPAC